MSSSRLRRADAQRNREALLAAAREAFVAGENDARVEEIARRAGLAVGTLYRHFETRDALVEEVYRHEVAAMCESARQRLNETTAAEALRLFLLSLVEHAVVGRGIAVALEGIMATDSPAFDEARNAMAIAIDQLLHAGAEEGTLRAEVSGRTVLRALSAICGMHERDDWREEASQISMLLFDGLRRTAAN